jgi:hypothetical protein
MKVPFDKDAFMHLVQTWYRGRGMVYQACHPRDILKVIVALCEYEGSEPRMTPELIDEACESYFVVV